MFFLEARLPAALTVQCPYPYCFIIEGVGVWVCVAGVCVFCVFVFNTSWVNHEAHAGPMIYGRLVWILHSYYLRHLYTCDARCLSRISHAIVMVTKGISGSAPLFSYSHMQCRTAGKTVTDISLRLRILDSSCDSCYSCLVDEWFFKMSLRKIPFFL